MQELRLGIIGAGRPWKTEGASGFGMSHAHMAGYKRAQGVVPVAVADINDENAKAFQREHGFQKTYSDYKQMLASERLDVVSVCTWPKLHAPMVVACAEAGVKAIHCEKPMAPTFGEARRMVEVCEARGVQLTFNHQRRFDEQFVNAKRLLKEGRIGKLIRMEMGCANLFDWGTHWFDMLFYYLDETPAKWVIGQIDTRETRDIFGAVNEGQGLAHVKFENGVHGLLLTGYERELEADQKLIGTDGVIEVNPKTPGFGPLRVWAKGMTDWEAVPSAGEQFQGAVALGVLDLVDALRTGREPELSGRRALRATELIFATYESSRRRGRVDLPLTIDDSPLMDMLGRAQ